MSFNIHPRFAGLPESAKNSEVVASQYASDALHMEEFTEDHAIEAVMSEWDQQLKSHGVTLPLELIQTLGEVSVVCQKNERADLAGKLAVQLTDHMVAVIKQLQASCHTISQLEAVADSLFSGADELKKNIDTLTHLLGKNGRSTKKNKGRSHHEKDNKPAAEQVVTSPLQPHNSPGVVVKVFERKGSNEGNKEVQNEDAAVPMEALSATADDAYPKTSQAKTMRATYRAHYAGEEFSLLPADKQTMAIEYYTMHILGVSAQMWEEDPNIYSMLSDLIDKERLMAVCKKAKEGAVDNDLLLESISEMADAIQVCYREYGNYGAVVDVSGDRPKLAITTTH